MEVSYNLIGVALEAYDSKAGYSKIEKMRAALEAALSTDADPVGYTDQSELNNERGHGLFAHASSDRKWLGDNPIPLYAVPVKTAPAMAVTDGLREAIEKLLDQAEHVCIGAHTPLDIKEAAKNLAEPIKNLHAALSAQAQDVAGWKPIETAPKDGTDIHVWAGGWGWPEVVRYELFEDEADAEEAGEPGYWVYSESAMADVFGFPNYETLTHWMPLAAAPAAKQGEAE